MQVGEVAPRADRRFLDMEQVPVLTGTGREWLIFLEAPEQALIRITAGTDLKFRVIGAQAASPVQLRLIKSVNAPEKGAKIVREIFAYRHSHGEWFEPDEPLRQFINELPDRAIVSHCIIDRWIAQYAKRRFFATDYFKPKSH